MEAKKQKQTEEKKRRNEKEGMKEGNKDDPAYLTSDVKCESELQPTDKK